MTGKLSVLSLLLVPFLGIGTYAGEYCEGIYCYYGCCEDDEVCCTAREVDPMSAGAWVGVIIAILVLKVIFWTVCCYFYRRRRSTIIVQRVMVPAQQTTVTMTAPAPNTNPSHVGYDQAGAMGMNPPRPGAPPAAPPPYDQATAMPLPHL